MVPGHSEGSNDRKLPWLLGILVVVVVKIVAPIVAPPATKAKQPGGEGRLASRTLTEGVDCLAQNLSALVRLLFRAE